MGEYPLLLDCLQERSTELEHAQSQKEVKESFVEMACSGVPPTLLTRVVMAYAGKVIEESAATFKIPQKIVDFYRVGVKQLLKKIREKLFSAKDLHASKANATFVADDEFHALRHDLYLVLYHLNDTESEAKNNVVKDVVVDMLIKYCKHKGTGVSEACIILESLVLSEIYVIPRSMHEAKTKSSVRDVRDEKQDKHRKLNLDAIPEYISNMFYNHFIELNNYGRLFVVNSLCQMESVEKIGFQLLDFHLVYDGLRGKHAALQLANKYVEFYETYCKSI